MAETYESKINREPVQGWTRRTVADGDYLQSKTIQPLVNRDSILAKGLDDTNTLINGISDKVDDVETKCNAQEALVKSLSGDVEDFCTSATEAFEQIKANEQTLAGNVEGVQQSVGGLSGDVWQMNFMGFKDSTTVFVKEEIEQGKHMFSFSSVGGGGGGTSYDMAWYPSVDAAGNISWEWNQTTTAPTTTNIKGPKGEDGPTGPNGKTPVLSANSYNLYWKYSDATSGWTDLGNFRGKQGETGEEGASPTVEIEGITGEDNRTGNKITFRYGEGLSNTTSYSAWDGLDGQGATVNLFGDKGIEVIHPAGSTNYTVGLSGGYYAPTLSAGSANKAGYSELAGSATYAEKFKVDNTDYTFSNLYSEVDTLSNASGRWDAHSALSATKLDKSIWDNNSGKFATSADLDENIQYAMTTNGWAEITGGSSFTGVETDNWISGDGTSNKPIGLSAEAASAIEAMADPYQIDGTQYVSVVPDPTTHKVTIGLDNAAASNITRVNSNADIWDNASAVSAKSYASINNQQVITTVNQGVSASLSAVQYVPNTAFQGAAPKLMFVVENDDDLLAKVNGGACSGKGTLFFVCSAIG